MKFITAVYEHGVFRPTVPVALPEGTTVLVQPATESLNVRELDAPAVDSDIEFIHETSGMLGWTGDAATLERIALDPEFGIREAP